MNYLYNGVELPKLPEWDTTVYPYATIHYSNFWNANVYILHMNSTPVYVADNSDGGGSAEQLYTSEAGNYLAFQFVPGTDSDWVEYEHGASGSYEADKGHGFEPTWTNTDIYWQDGTLYLAASAPVLARWKTLFEGEVVIEAVSAGTSTAGSATLLGPGGLTGTLFEPGDTIRWTINGVPYVQVAVDTSDSYFTVDRTVGNIYLTRVLDSTNPPADDGTDYAVRSGNGAGFTAGKYFLVFYARTSGTYAVRLEKASTTADPIDKASFLQGWLVGRRLAGMRSKKSDEPAPIKKCLLSGTWEFNSNLNFPADGIRQLIEFESSYTSSVYGTRTDFSGFQVLSVNIRYIDTSNNEFIVCNSSGWDENASRFVKFKNETYVSEDFFNWFTENASQVDAGET